MTDGYVMQVRINICDRDAPHRGLEVTSEYTVAVQDLLTVLRIVADLEQYARKLAREARP